MRSFLVVVALAVATVAVEAALDVAQDALGRARRAGVLDQHRHPGHARGASGEPRREGHLHRRRTQEPSGQAVIRGANDAFFGESRDHWRDYGKRQHQTSMIVDPTNGRLPTMTPDGARRQPLIPNEVEGQPASTRPGLSPTARCISRGVYGSMLPIGNSSGNHIVQSPGFVVIRNEMIHEARIIQTDGRKHVGAAISGYMGDSQGAMGRRHTRRGHHQHQGRRRHGPRAAYDQ